MASREPRSHTGPRPQASPASEGAGASPRVLPARVRAARVGLVALMAVGSVMLWLGLPLGWIYLASQLVSSAEPSLGPYLLILFGIPVSMFLVIRALHRLEAVYSRISGVADEGPVRASWLKSMRGERGSTRRRTVLDVVMVWSVGVALVAFLIWWVGFAGSPLPR